MSDLNMTPAPAALSHLTVSPSPITQFELWFAEASKTPGLKVEDFCLATSTPTGAPSARMVMLKGVSPRGLAFHTHAASRKAQELTVNPSAALLFFWAPLGRSVRVEGHAEQVTPEESDVFFLGRPRDGLLAAWASPHSSVVKEGEVRAEVESLRKGYEGKDIPRPEHWGGWRIVPKEMEFFQTNMEDRLHDRVRYSLSCDGTWVIERLAP